jgi:hypothetical protein
VDGLGRVEVQVPEQYASDAEDLLQEESGSESADEAPANE